MIPERRSTVFGYSRRTRRDTRSCRDSRWVRRKRRSGIIVPSAKRARSPSRRPLLLSATSGRSVALDERAPRTRVSRIGNDQDGGTSHGPPRVHVLFTSRTRRSDNNTKRRRPRWFPYRGRLGEKRQSGLRYANTYDVHGTV